MNKIILGVIVLLVIVGGIVYFTGQKQEPAMPASPTSQGGEDKDSEAMSEEKDESMTTTPSPTPASPTSPTPPPPASPPPTTPPPVSPPPATSQVKTFNLTGQNFTFSQSEIRVKKGDTVKINFESVEGFHDWSLDTYNVQTSQVNAGSKTSVQFVADKTGTFEYYCSVGNHRALGIVGNLIVE